MQVKHPSHTSPDGGPFQTPSTPDNITNDLEYDQPPAYETLYSPGAAPSHQTDPISEKTTPEKLPFSTVAELKKKPNTTAFAEKPRTWRKGCFKNAVQCHAKEKHNGSACRIPIKEKVPDTESSNPKDQQFAKMLELQAKENQSTIHLRLSKERNTGAVAVAAAMEDKEKRRSDCPLGSLLKRGGKRC